jgi:hypothetical protein
MGFENRRRIIYPTLRKDPQVSQSRYREDEAAGCSGRVFAILSRRCIDGKTPHNIGPRRNPGVNGSGWKCRGVPQEEMLPRGLCGSAGVCEAGLPATSPLRANGGVLPAPGQVLQDQALPAQILPQESVLSASGRSSLRNARLLRRPGRFATGFWSALRPAYSRLHGR